MNIDTLKAMLELTAVQNFHNDPSSNTSTSSSLFENILSELLTGNVQQSNPYPAVRQSTPSAQLSSLNDMALPPLSLIKSNGKFDSYIQQAADKYGISANLIKAVIKQESNFNPEAVSGSGAAGLMQLMPATANSLGADNVFDPKQNIFAGAKYLKQMLDKYDGKVELALAAYNAGPGNVDRYGGIPPFKETENYVRRITQTLA